MRQIALDTETTGIDFTDGHRVIEIGCIEMDNRRITGREYHCYLNPERDIDEGAARVHGLTLDKLKGEPLFKDVVDEFLEFISDSELIIHNAKFDLGFLNNELSLIGQSESSIESYAMILDTLKMARGMHPGKRNSLDALCNRYEIDRSMRQVHGALIDAKLLAKVYLKMTEGQETHDLEQASNMNSIIIKLSGEIQSSNFNEWQEMFFDKIKSFQQELKTDNDFHHADENIKWCQSAEKALKSAKDSAIKQASDIEMLFNEIDKVISQARHTRLILQRQIKSRKLEIKDKVAIEGVVKMTEHLAMQSDDFNLLDNSMFTNKENFLSVISGSRGTGGAKIAVDKLCSRFINQISQRALEVQNKATTIDALAFGYHVLFQDRGYLLGLQLDDLNKEIGSRIATYTANQERMNTKRINEDEESIETDEEVVSEDQEVALESEEVTDHKFMGIAETKGIISKLLQDHDNENIIMALKTCLRLLEEESKRNGQA